MSRVISIKIKMTKNRKEIKKEDRHDWIKKQD